MLTVFLISLLLSQFSHLFFFQVHKWYCDQRGALRQSVKDCLNTYCESAEPDLSGDLFSIHAKKIANLVIKDHAATNSNIQYIGDYLKEKYIDIVSSDAE